MGERPLGSAKPPGLSFRRADEGHALHSLQLRRGDGASPVSSMCLIPSHLSSQKRSSGFPLKVISGCLGSSLNPPVGILGGSPVTRRSLGGGQHRRRPGLKIVILPRHYGFAVDSRESGETVVLRTVGSSVSHRT